MAEPNMNIWHMCLFLQLLPRSRVLARESCHACQPVFLTMCVLGCTEGRFRCSTGGVEKKGKKLTDEDCWGCYLLCRTDQHLLVIHILSFSQTERKRHEHKQTYTQRETPTRINLNQQGLHNTHLRKFICILLSW